MDYDLILLGLFLSTLFKINGFFAEILANQQNNNFATLGLLYFCIRRFGILIFTYCCRIKLKHAAFTKLYERILDTILVASCYFYICYL